MLVPTVAAATARFSQEKAVRNKGLDYFAGVSARTFEKSIVMAA
jgi:hypothetical protein